MTETLWNTAERLRTVRDARQRFVTMWALQQATRLFESQWSARCASRSDLFSDPDAHLLGNADWKCLYRGSVLDD
ncbi:MAG TPA: hypothetical protein PLD59_09675 [Tepidisphaeraceae bacterium]|nr:hypothetical protein [Tepidisphaeraceae bacterium]